MVEHSIDRKRDRHDLKMARTKLFGQFLRHPKDIRLALAVKIIDGQIANCTERIRKKEENEEKEFQKIYINFQQPSNHRFAESE